VVRCADRRRLGRHERLQTCPERRKVLRIGAIMFIIFGAFFEMIFQSFALSKYIFPVALILLGLYLVFRRAGFLSAKKNDDQSNNISTL
jgi:uncharacterized membrane protein YfcA